jgi:hypothetical protein
MSTLTLDDIPTEQAEETKNILIARSREIYGTPKEAVEKSLEYLRDQKAESIKPELEKQPTIITPPVPEEKEPQQKQTIQPTEITDNKTKDRLVKQKNLSEHRYAQMYIKKMAESRGYKASIEELTPNGNGKVDVSLERNGKRIACEIGMTTTTEWELHNIEKCIAAGYDVVVAIAKSKEMIRVMQEEIKKNIDVTFQSKVMVLEAESLVAYLDTEIAKEASTETRIKGYRVKVEYVNPSDGDIPKKK